MSKKKLLLVALSAILISTSAFATQNPNACTVNGSNGLAVVPQVIAVGSSAQFNTFAYAVAEVLTAAAGDTGINSGDYNLFTATKTVKVNDNRFPFGALGDSANPVFFMYDNNNTCNLYAYFETDSGIGVKDFFATVKFTPANQTGTAKSYSIAGATVSVGNFSGSSNNQVPGLPDNVSSLPAAIASYFNTPWVPTYSATTHTLTNAPLPYCGSTTTNPTTNGWCVFNLAATDIRPEDALYAATRALTTLSTTAYTGLGYNNASCDAGQGGDTTATQGCPIFDAFNQGKVFNVLKFSISGADPVQSGTTVPPYTTLSTGAAPIVIIVNDADTSTYGFGKGASSGGGAATSYTFTNINRPTLSQIFQGNLHCTGDLLPGTASSGQPIQEIQREPLSGTYNTFEFTGVRTLLGSANAAVTAASSTSWPSDDDRGMENGVNPATGFNTAACGFTGWSFGSALSAQPNATTDCGDPVYISTGTAGKACGTGGWRARSVGSSVEVKGTMGAYFTNPGGQSVTDGIGFSFWSYGNLAPMATNCVAGQATQKDYNTTCTFLGHYLTVDSIDPLWSSQGGVSDAGNPAEAYQPPQCDFSNLPCAKIPFTHIQDGTYPLWSLLRDVTFPTSTSLKMKTPAAVVTLIAYAEYEASQNDRLSDFVPFLSVTTPGAADPTGNLNLGVFRQHFKNTNNPNNGHEACQGVFTGIYINPSDPLNAHPGCLVDAGGDVGGAVMSVQADIDFNADFGSLFLGGKYELYGQHQ